MVAKTMGQGNWPGVKREGEWSAGTCFNAQLSREGKWNCLSAIKFTGVDDHVAHHLQMK